MEKEKHWGDSKEALLMEGLSMLAFGAVAWCYSGPELLIMLTPFGMVLFVGGVARLLLNSWHFHPGSQWRRLLRQSGWSDIFISAAAFIFLSLDLLATIELFAAWLIFSGYFHVRRFLYLKEKYGPGCSFPLGALGWLSILAGILLGSDALWPWLSHTHYFSGAAILLGLGKIYAFFKPDPERRRSREKGMEGQIGRRDRPSPLSPLNLN